MNWLDRILRGEKKKEVAERFSGEVRSPYLEMGGPFNQIMLYASNEGAAKRLHTRIATLAKELGIELPDIKIGGAFNRGVPFVLGFGHCNTVEEVPQTVRQTLSAIVAAGLLSEKATFVNGLDTLLDGQLIEQYRNQLGGLGIEKT